MDTALYLPPLDVHALAGGAVTLSFWAQNDLEDNHDFLFVESKVEKARSIDGVWLLQETLTGRNDQYEQRTVVISLPSDATVLHLRLRLVTDKSVVADGLHLDDFSVVAGVLSPTNTPTVTATATNLPAGVPTNTPTPTPVFDVQVSVATIEEMLDVGDIFATNVTVRNNGECEFDVYEILLTRQGNGASRLEHYSPRRISGTNIAASTTFTLTAISPGTAELIATAYGEARCGANQRRFQGVNSPVQIVEVAFPAPPFEPNDACPDAGTLTPSGSSQLHNFQAQGDVDWVRFQAQAGTTYLIQAQVPPDSEADVALALFESCQAAEQQEENPTFSPTVHMQFTAPTDGDYYLRLDNNGSDGAGSTYQLSINPLIQQASGGAVIIVAGKLKENDPVQSNIHQATDAMYRLFRDGGYDDDRITYLATDPTLDGYDGLATAEAVRKAITEWAAQAVGQDQNLTLYLMDHGKEDILYLDGLEETIAPAQLNDWLNQLEQARPDAQVNVITAACHSGSFIDANNGTLRKDGRLVISSTGVWNLAWAAETGAFFSNHLLKAVKQGENLCDAFWQARWATLVAHPDQTPWLDVNGNGVPNEVNECTQSRFLDLNYVANASDPYPPFFQDTEAPATLNGPSGQIRAQVLDDRKVQRVWAVVYPPSYQIPEESDSLNLLPTEPVELAPQSDDWYTLDHNGFTEVGRYRIVLQAMDVQGLDAQPVTVLVERKGLTKLYMPTVLNGGDDSSTDATGRKVFLPTLLR